MSTKESAYGELTLSDPDIGLEVMKKNPAFRRQWLKAALEKTKLDRLWLQMIEEEEQKSEN